MQRKNRCEHFEECEECDDDAMKCKHTESNNNTAEFVSIMEEEYEESEKQYEQTQESENVLFEALEQ